MYNIVVNKRFKQNNYWTTEAQTSKSWILKRQGKKYVDAFGVGEDSGEDS